MFLLCVGNNDCCRILLFKCEDCRARMITVIEWDNVVYLSRHQVMLKLISRKETQGNMGILYIACTNIADTIRKYKIEKIITCFFVLAK